MPDVIDGELPWERILRGSVGIGAVFGVIAFALMIVWLAAIFLIFPEAIDWNDLDFMVIAPFGWGFIAYLLGMIYGVVLALVARGRSFREVSITRAGLAGAAVGLIPALVVLVGSFINGGTPDELDEALMLFPPIGATFGILTLLIARRAKERT